MMRNELQDQQSIEITRVSNGWIIRPAIRYTEPGNVGTFCVATTPQQLVEIIEIWAVLADKANV